MDFRIKNILVPTDFSSSANVALRLAIEMANRHTATIHLISVIKPIIWDKFIYIDDAYINIEDRMLKLAQKKIARHENSILNYTTLTVKSKVEVGNLDSVIQKYELENNIDLTVIGTHGETGYDEEIIGTNAISIIKKSNCPVLSVPPTFDKLSFDKILFPIRFVSGVEEKFDFIKPIIEKNDATVHLLGLYEPNKNDEIYPITDELQKIKNRINNNGYTVSYELNSTENIEEFILATIDTTKSDLVIINATLDKKWYHFFGGNTFTDNIVNKSKVPVLSIKPSLTAKTIESALRVVFFKAEQYVPLEINYSKKLKRFS